jgi:hypothetical protein
VLEYFGKKRQPQMRAVDVRDVYDASLFDGLTLLEGNTTAEGTLTNLLIQGECTRLTLVNLLEETRALHATQKELLEEMRAARSANSSRDAA